MAAEGTVIHCETVQSWNQQLQTGTDSKKVIVVDFTVTWCAPCKMMAPVFEELAVKFPGGLFVKVDVDELKYVTADWEVKAMPTFILIQDGKPVDTVVGVIKKELEAKVAPCSLGHVELCWRYLGVIIYYGIMEKFEYTNQISGGWNLQACFAFCQTRKSAKQLITPGWPTRIVAHHLYQFRIVTQPTGCQ